MGLSEGGADSGSSSTDRYAQIGSIGCSSLGWQASGSAAARPRAARPPSTRKAVMSGKSCAPRREKVRRERSAERALMGGGVGKRAKSGGRDASGGDEGREVRVVLGVRAGEGVQWA